MYTVYNTTEGKELLVKLGLMNRMLFPASPLLLDLTLFGQHLGVTREYSAILRPSSLTSIYHDLHT